MNTLQDLRLELKKTFPERDNPIDGSLTAILAREHVLLLGLPGEAKSALVRAICDAITGWEYFEYCLQGSTVWDELIGQFDVPAFMRGGAWQRDTRHKLGQATIAFLDEIWKCNSTTLNGLLPLTNERYYYDGASRQTAPLVTLFGASNELPESKDLDALYDRFVLRYWIPRVSSLDNWQIIMDIVGEPVVTTKIDATEIIKLQALVATVTFGPTMVELFRQLKLDLDTAGFDVSTRTWRKVKKMVAARAVLNDRTIVEEDDFAIMADMLWREPKERPALAELIGKRSNPLMAEAIKIRDMASDLIKTFPEDFSSDDSLKKASNINKRLKQMIKEGKVKIEGIAKTPKAAPMIETLRWIKGEWTKLVQRLNVAQGTDSTDLEE